MEDCAASCFEFGDASEEAHDDGSSAPRRQLRSNDGVNIDDGRCGNSEKGSTSTASPNSIDVEQSTNDEAHQDERSTVESAQSNGIPSPEDATNHHHRLFFCVMTAVSIGGMGVATFGVLAGGKAGFTLPKEIFHSLAYGAVDIAVDLNAVMQTHPATVLPGLRKRGATSTSWLAIAILSGSANALRLISFDAKREGTVWQPKAIICLFIVQFVCGIGLVGMVVLRAHCDRQPNAMKWVVLNYSSLFLATSGSSTPYPLISALGNVLSLLSVTFGVYFLVMKIDNDAVTNQGRTKRLQTSHWVWADRGSVFQSAHYDPIFLRPVRNFWSTHAVPKRVPSSDNSDLQTMLW